MFLYHDRTVTLHSHDPAKNILRIGNVVLTAGGKELAPICGARQNPEFYEYVLNKWTALGLEVNIATQVPFVPSQSNFRNLSLVTYRPDREEITKNGREGSIHVKNFLPELQ